MKENSTKQINEELAEADKNLHDIQSQMTVPNVVRTMIESGKTMEEIDIYVKSIIQLGVRMKSDALKEIERCHLELAKRHMKLTDNWQFVNIGEKSK